MHYIVSKILQQINLLDSFDEKQVFNQPEVLNNTCFPIYPSIQRQLQLSFASNPKYKLKCKSLFIDEVVKKFCEFYSNNHDLVEYNVNLVQKKFSAFTKYQIPICIN